MDKATLVAELEAEVSRREGGLQMVRRRLDKEGASPMLGASYYLERLAKEREELETYLGALRISLAIAKALPEPEESAAAKAEALETIALERAAEAGRQREAAWLNKGNGAERSLLEDASWLELEAEAMDEAAALWRAAKEAGYGA
jgi:hypothetical protein